MNIHEAKTQLSKLVECAANGEEIIIAKAGKPIARLAPLNDDLKNRRQGGWSKDLFKDVNIDAVFDPALDKELEDLFLNGPLFPEEE